MPTSSAQLRVNLLRLIWFLALLYGEIFIYRTAINKCQWRHWQERLPSDKFYHVVLVADPQLIDNYSYKRRGLVMSLTKYYTDTYMKRNYRLMQDLLKPDLVIFMGDLFDGGREWHDEEWMLELERFDQIFPSHPEKLALKSLPGNHDVGVSNGVYVSVLSRFQKHFGPSSRTFDTGTHELVLLDTVSLENTIDENIYGPPKKFLKGLQKSPVKKPRILFSHVPLFRKDGTDCGPLREGNMKSIRLGAGYQYQNVLTPDITDQILDIVQPSAIFSGDDHDYCEVLHTLPGGGNVTEISVKSFSWAMGVKYPGFQLLALSPSSYQTIPCILPPQIYILLTYALLAAVTIVTTILATSGIPLTRYKEPPALPIARDDVDVYQLKYRKTARLSKSQYLNYFTLQFLQTVWPVITLYSLLQIREKYL